MTQLHFDSFFNSKREKETETREKQLCLQNPSRQAHPAGMCLSFVSLQCSFTPLSHHRNLLIPVTNLNDNQVTRRENAEKRHWWSGYCFEQDCKQSLNLFLFPQTQEQNNGDLKGNIKCMIKVWFSPDQLGQTAAGRPSYRLPSNWMGRPD